MPEVSEGPGFWIEIFQAVGGADPDDSLPVYGNAFDDIAAQTAGFFRIMQEPGKGEIILI